MKEEMRTLSERAESVVGGFWNSGRVLVPRGRPSDAFPPRRLIIPRWPTNTLAYWIQP